ncbi:MAG: hypothetical protein PHQ40_00450 [Anaerolineaceae bacterium]|nr:hypothetical protein [Anaerolineaceae bacterium]MDD5367526.1 hypothetical protein [Anaerolineaceae bacterium]
MKTWHLNIMRLFLLLGVFLFLGALTTPVFAQTGDPPVPTPIDFSRFINVSVGGIPLVLPIIGIVGVLQKAGLKDKQLLAASFINGFIWGCGYQVTQLRPPIGDFWIVFGYWFPVLAYGAALAVIASLFYDLFKGMIDKLINKAILTLLGNQVDPNVLAQVMRRDLAK